MTDSLNNLEKLYMMPDGLKGIQRSASNIQGSLSAVRSTMNTFVGVPTQAAKNNLNKATIEVNEAIEKIETFLNGPFANYKKKVESLSFSLFK
jgi:DNA anti-recombination protein RmuC